MKTCAKICMDEHAECKNRDCRLWLDYSEDLNCTLITVTKHGPLTLREVAEREGVSFVRIKQIETQALKKLRKNGVD